MLSTQVQDEATWKARARFFEFNDSVPKFKSFNT